MTPELPRAPISAPKLMAAATRSAGWPAVASASSSAALHRREHVRAGVAVGDRVDVERVDLVDVRLEVRDGGAERGEEPRAVARAAGHQATSVPLSARSRGPTDVRIRVDDRRAARRPARSAGRRCGWSAAGPRDRAPDGARSGPPNRPGGRPRRPGRRRRPSRSSSMSMVAPRCTVRPGLGEPESLEQALVRSRRRSR